LLIKKNIKQESSDHKHEIQFARLLANLSLFPESIMQYPKYYLEFIEISKLWQISDNIQEIYIQLHTMIMSCLLSVINNQKFKIIQVHPISTLDVTIHYTFVSSSLAYVTQEIKDFTECNTATESC
jgi:hypothetical protein